MDRIKNIHPGEVLLEEFLKPLNITQYALAQAISVDQTRISEIIKNKRKITPDTAIRLGKFFNTSPQFWLGLQNDYDLEEEKLNKEKIYSSIKPYSIFQSSRHRNKKLVRSPGKYKKNPVSSQ
jgi:addiction module HigA family antidote